MTRIKLVGLCLVAVFAMGALGASEAMAAPLHVYKVESKTLAAGETKEITSSAKTEFVLKGKGLFNVEAVTKCKKLKLKASLHPDIVGGTPGRSEHELIEFEECSATAGGIACSSVEVEGAATNNELVTILKPESKKGKLATLFTPIGKTFSKIKLNSCGLLGNQSAEVEGSTAAGIVPEAVEETKGTLVWNEKEEITEIEKQNGSKAIVGLTSDKKLATLNGEATVELVSGQKWGAF